MTQLTFSHDNLFALYNRPLVLRMTKAVLDTDKMTGMDTVFLPGMTLEEFDNDAKGMIDIGHVPTVEEENFFNQMRSMVGKKLSDLPQLTAEEEQEYLDSETDIAISHLLASWISLLGVAAHKGHLKLSDLLVPIEPIKYSWSDTPIDWMESICVSIALTKEQVAEVHAEFVATLKFTTTLATSIAIPGSTINKTDSGYELALPPHCP